MNVTSTASVLAGPAVIHSDPEIVSGTPVFVGTRVPVEAFFDYLEGGDDLDEFLDDFPTVRREQVLGVLRIARSKVIEVAHARSPR